MRAMFNSLGYGMTDWLLLASLALAGLTLLGWVACRALRGKSPALRYLVWSAVLMASIILPSLWLYGPELRLPILEAPPAGLTTPRKAVATEPPKVMITERVDTSILSAEAPADVPLNKSTQSVPMKRMLTLAWALGVGLLLTRLAVAGYRLSNLCRRALVVDPKQLTQILGIGKVRILLSEEIEGPMCCGWRRPSVILPWELWKEQSPEELRMILGHELAHVSRRDTVSNLLQRLVEALFFFHPCVWYASAQLSHERERICDNHVLEMGAKATDYVQMLSGLLERGWCGAEPQSVALFEGKLLPRVRSLLDGRSSTSVRLPGKLRLVLIGLIAVMMTGVGVVRLEAKTSIGETFDVSSNTPAASDLDRVAGELKEIGKKIEDYRRTNGRYSDNLKAVWGGSKSFVDPYSPAGKSYAYEAVHRYAMVSSCGPDGIPGNDDDPVHFIAGSDRHSGSRAEIRQAGLLSGDPNGQYEYSSRDDVPRPKGNCSISGHVVSKASGNPINHARVYLHYRKTFASIFINVAKDGSYVFRDIPVGEFSLSVGRARGYQDQYYDVENKGRKFFGFSLNEGEQRSVHFELEEECRVSGRLVDLNGQAVNGADVGGVAAWAPNKLRGGYEIIERSEVDKNGHFSIGGLDDRPVLLMALDWRADEKEDTYPPQYYPGTFDRNKAVPVTFDVNRHVENLEIRMQRKGGVVLSGQVKDDRGAPVPNAFVTVYRSDMYFDVSSAYSDEQGNYEIQGLAPGQFQIDVDAVQADWVRLRKTLDISQETGELGFNVQLQRGLKISGRFVDESGQPWGLVQSYGSAYSHTHTTNCSSGTATPATVESVSFTLTGFHNKHRSTSVLCNHHGSFVPGDGNYDRADIFFPTRTSFVIEGVAPGETKISFQPKKEGCFVKEILYDGKDILESGLPTEPGKDIEGVVIVIGEES